MLDVWLAILPETVQCCCVCLPWMLRRLCCRAEPAPCSVCWMRCSKPAPWELPVPWPPDCTTYMHWWGVIMRIVMIITIIFIIKLHTALMHVPSSWWARYVRGDKGWVVLASCWRVLQRSNMPEIKSCLRHVQAVQSASKKVMLHAQHWGIMPLLLTGTGSPAVTKLHQEACSCIQCGLSKYRCIVAWGATE